MWKRLFTLWATVFTVMRGMSVEPELCSYSVALPQRNLGQAKDLLLDVSDPSSDKYGQYLSRDEIWSMVGPSSELINTVEEWFNTQTETQEVKYFGDMLKVKAPCGIDYWEKIPTNIRKKVDFIETRVPKNFTHLPISFSRNGVDPGFCPREVLDYLYNMKDLVTTSHNVSAGAIEYQGQSGFSEDDLVNLEELDGIPANNVSSGHIVGTDGDPDVESQLDIQMLGLTAVGADLWYWDDDGWLYSFATSFFNTKNVPDVISMSWGWATDSQCDITQCGNLTSLEYAQRVDAEYVKLGLRGVTVVVASGDAGAPGRTNEDCSDSGRPVNPVMPGSSPWVTSIGATFVADDSKKRFHKTGSSDFCQQNTCATGTAQYVTNVNDTGWTSGSGFGFEETPKWQKSQVSQYLKDAETLPSKFNSKGRSYPDFVMVGHNLPVMDGGFIEGVDGTSASSPLAAGVLTLLNDNQVLHGKPKLGFVNPLLYKMGNDVFTDIPVGDTMGTEVEWCGQDNGYIATSAFDAVTGWGYPDVKKMIQWLDKNT